MTPSRPGRRTAALTVGLGLVAGSLLVAPAAPAAAAPQNDSVAAVAGGDWLVDQLGADDLVYNDQFEFTDYALTVDVGLALDTFDGTRYTGALGDLTSAVTTPEAVRDNTSGESFGDAGSRYAGATAKLASFVQQRGGDATAVGGVDLVAELSGLVADDAPISGRVEDRSTFGDSANALSQGFAARALTVAGDEEAGSAMAFFLDQQCDAGFFRTFLTPDKAAADQTCEGGVAAGESTAAPDATAIAVLNLLATTPDAGSRDAVAVDDAVDWLLAAQAADGSFTGGDGPTDVPNANSTGVAGWALAEAGEPGAATAAAAWVAGRQVAGLGPCEGVLTPGQDGAVAYDDAAFADGTDAGIVADTRDQWRRTSAQAVPALRSLPAPGTPSLDASSGVRFVRAGSTVSLPTSGVAVGQKTCVTGPGGPFSSARPAGSEATVAVDVPRGTALRQYTLGQSSVTVSALAAKRLDVRRSRAAVARGATQTVTVRDLADREKVTVRLRGRVVDTGVATRDGFFRSRFVVRGATGPAQVRVTGRFADIRSGSTTFRVR